MKVGTLVTGGLLSYFAYWAYSQAAEKGYFDRLRLDQDRLEEAEKKKEKKKKKQEKEAKKKEE